MERPQFTDEEEVLIRYIRKHDQAPIYTILRWLPWLLITAAVFTYGFLTKQYAFIFAGFSIAFYLLCHFIYYQVRPSWQLKPIIDKYEASYSQNAREGR